jgi:hypothetical protein
MNRFRSYFVIACAVFCTALGLQPLPADAQTTPIELRVVVQSATRSVGGLITSIQVVNNGAESLTNVQLVVRIPNLPAVIQAVTQTTAPFVDSNNRVGVIDEKSGVWYHTIASVPVGTTGLTFNVNWFNPCAGRWPIAARANDRRTFSLIQFTGIGAANCGLDDQASPTPSSWYELPWPPSAPLPTTPGASSTLGTIPSASTSSSAVLPTTTVFGATSTIAVPSTIPGATAPTTTPAVTTAPVAPTTRVTTIAPTTLKRVTVPKPTTTKRPSTTLEIVCKTVGGKRYCGPKSSALKPGQKKPKSVPPSTKKKSKSKK